MGIKTRSNPEGLITISSKKRKMEDRKKVVEEEGKLKIYFYSFLNIQADTYFLVIEIDSSNPVEAEVINTVSIDNSTRLPLK